MLKESATEPTTGGTSQGATPPAKRAIRLKTLNDVRVEMTRVYSDARRNQIPTDQASKLVYVLSQVGRVIEGSTLEDRLAALEAKATTP